jgi:hypothetical protein
MKKILLILAVSLIMHNYAKAQSDCQIDTIYRYQFFDGSTTKTPTGRTIYLPGPNTDLEFRPAIYQVFKNGTYVNSEKTEITYNSADKLTAYTDYEWDTVALSWVITYKENYTYNANNLLSEFTNQIKNQSGVLVNDEKLIYSYNTINKQTAYVTQKWVNGNWRNTRQQQFTYQSDSLLVLDLTQTWDTVSNSWVNSQKTERTFDATGKEITTAVFNWDINSSQWKGNFYYVKAFNQQGFQILFEELYWDNNANTFAKAARTIYVRNNDGLSTTDTIQSWNSITSEYVTSQIRHYTYNANGKLIVYRVLFLNGNTGLVNSLFLSNITLDAADRPLLIFDQDSSSTAAGSWRPFRKWTYNYDNNGNQLSELFEYRMNGDTLTKNYRQQNTYANNKPLTGSRDNWNISLGDWTPVSRDLNEYNSDGFRTAYEGKSGWNASGNYFNNHVRNEYKCGLVSIGLDKVFAKQVEVTIYPNPCNNLLNIQTSSAVNTVMIFDLQGQLKMTSTPLNNQIDLSGLANGMYIVQVTTASGSAHRTIVKQ